MSEATLWHNPRCSKSREALELLRAHDIEPVIRDYLAQPPSEDELSVLLSALGIPARELLRSADPEAKELGLEDESLGDADLIAAMAAHPQLIQRPILIAGDRAIIARPPERVLELLPHLADKT